MVQGKVKPSLADRRIALDSFRLGVNRFSIRRHAAGAKAADTPTLEHTAENQFSAPRSTSERHNNYTNVRRFVCFLSPLPSLRS